MATTKKAKTKPAGGGKDLAQYDAKLAELARRTVQLEDTAAVGGNVINTRGGVLSYKKNPVPNNTLLCVVLDSTLVNAYYEEKFDPENPTPPDCFAISQEDAKKMVPHELAMHKQSDTCAKCKQNQWGSSDRGRGKACKNSRRLILITEDMLESSDAVASAEAATMSIPPTSSGAWHTYVTQLESILHRPPLGVITEISIKPDAKDQFHIQFKHSDTIDRGDIIEALIAKQEQVRAQLMRPFEPQEETAKPAKAAGNKAKAKGRR